MKQKDKRSNIKGKKKIPHRSKIKSFPKNLSSLSLTYHLTEMVSSLGFDWPNITGVLEKLDEEVEEFREAVFLRTKRKIREEMGDLLFVLVNIARVLQIDPEEALRMTIKKFIIRFKYVEKSLFKRGKNVHESNLGEMDRLWEEAKKKEKRYSK